MSTRIAPASTYRRGKMENSPKGREIIMKPYLPPPEEELRPIRHYFATKFHRFVLFLLHCLAGLYIRTRYLYHLIINRWFAVLYYHHRTPQLIQKDIKQLDRLPQHLSIILEFEKDGGVETLIDNVAEISAWCASAGIPMLSVYERSGVLKKYLASSHRAIAQRLHAYFGSQRPTLRVMAPHSQSFANGDVYGGESEETADLEVTFISEEDGRESLVDLTKTLCEMTQKGKMTENDITQELIDAEIESLTIPEPDLLILFSPNVKLHGYPPWQIRLTEIFHVADNDTVGYQVFLRALYRFAKAQFRFGR